MGVYTKVANLMQGERPVYQRVGSTVMYLFYWLNTTEWRVGGNYTLSPSGVKSTGNAGAACPDQAMGWLAAAGGVWVSTYPITVVQATVGNAPDARMRSGPPTGTLALRCSFHRPHARAGSGQRLAYYSSSRRVAALRSTPNRHGAFPLNASAACVRR